MTGLQLAGTIVGIAAGSLAILGALFGGLRWLWRRAGGQPDVGDRLERVETSLDRLARYVDGLPQAKADVRDPFQEGERLQRADQHEAAIAEFEKAFGGAENDSQRSALHGLIGNSFYLLGRLQEAEGHYRQALHMADRGRDPEGRARALANLGNVYADKRHLRKAEDHYKEALEIDQQIANRAGQGADLGNLGMLYVQRGDLDAAERHWTRALAMYEDAGDRVGQAMLLSNLGIVYADTGHPEKAEEHYKRVLKMHQQTGDALGQGRQLVNLGLLQGSRGDAPGAFRCLRKARRIFAKAGASAEIQETDELIEGLETPSTEP